MGLVMASMLVFPYVTTVRSYDVYGAAWQGRYGLPVAMGAVLLAAYVLDRSGRAVPGPVNLTMLLLFAVAQALAVGYTTTLVRGDPPAAPAVVLAAAGAALFWWGACGRDRAAGESQRATS
jgi:hypothetical protein